MTANVIQAGESHTKAVSFKADGLAGFERTRWYREQGLVWLFATRGLVPVAVVDSWDALQWPPNQFHSGRIGIQGAEVGEAYEQLVEFVTDEAKAVEMFGEESATRLLRAPFILTLEEDNIPPPHAITKLLETIFACPECGGEVQGDGWVCAAGHRGFDAVSGLYWIKSRPPVPMAFGTPSGSDEVDFKPVSVDAAVEAGGVIEVNGIAMGCAIWRKTLFGKVSRPWFKTENDYSQDLFFCRKAKQEAGARFAVHCGVRVAHLDYLSMTFY